jgi:D-alanine-D-alanine ligase
MRTGLTEFMERSAHIAVILNEPPAECEETHKSLAESRPGSFAAPLSESAATAAPGTVDLSEVGVIEEAESAEKALRVKGYRTALFNIEGDVKRLIRFLEEEKPDLVFNLCESLKGQAIHEMHVAGIYELMGVAYTGAGTLALGTCLNKVRTKEILCFHGIRTARYAIFADADSVSYDDIRLDFPVIVKPSREDASIGIENASVVNDFESLKQRIAYVVGVYNQPALVEEYIDGRELNVAIIGNDKPLVLPISEIDFAKLPSGYPKIVTYNAKWLDGSAEFVGTVGTCPAKLEPEIERIVRQTALKAYRLLEVRDYARIDIRLDARGTPFVLEVNPNPDISRDAGFVRSAWAFGMTFDDMIVKIVECALERSRR